MKVKELIKKLQKIDNQNAEVVTRTTNNDGCDTCGWGATISEHDVTDVVDLESRVELVIDA